MIKTPYLSLSSNKANISYQIEVGKMCFSGSEFINQGYIEVEGILSMANLQSYEGNGQLSAKVIVVPDQLVEQFKKFAENVIPTSKISGLNFDSCKGLIEGIESYLVSQQSNFSEEL